MAPFAALSVDLEKASVPHEMLSFGSVLRFFTILWRILPTQGCRPKIMVTFCRVFEPNPSRNLAKGYPLRDRSGLFIQERPV